MLVFQHAPAARTFHVFRKRAKAASRSMRECWNTNIQFDERSPTLRRIRDGTLHTLKPTCPAAECRSVGGGLGFVARFGAASFVGDVFAVGAGRLLSHLFEGANQMMLRLEAAGLRDLLGR